MKINKGEFEFHFDRQKDESLKTDLNHRLGKIFIEKFEYNENKTIVLLVDHHTTDIKLIQSCLNGEIIEVNCVLIATTRARRNIDFLLEENIVDSFVEQIHRQMGMMRENVNLSDYHTLLGIYRFPHRIKNQIESTSIRYDLTLVRL